jgi:hypothetical protein
MFGKDFLLFHLVPLQRYLYLGLELYESNNHLPCPLSEQHGGKSFMKGMMKKSQKR